MNLNLLFSLMIMTLIGCAGRPDDPNFGKVDFKEVKQTFGPLPEYVINPNKKTNQARIALGKKLYFEKRLSLANDLSCNTCHQLDRFGVDNEPTSPGHKGQRGDRNSPSVYNAGLHLAQFWDGRAKDLTDQAKGPILNPIEMAMPSEKEVIKRLKNDPEYPALFKKAFPRSRRALSYHNMGRAIAAFEANLLTPSRFDKYLKGDQEALSIDEKHGLREFMQVGCIDCHNGVGIGGGMYQKLGLEVPYPNLKDKGRYNVTKDKDDMYFFKVPSLRNVAETGPYFHDGSIKDLDKAVQLMGKHQLGKELSRVQVRYIIKFLKSLTGEVPKYVKE